MEYFISLLPWYIKTSAVYYVVCATFYFLMWFFKRPLSVIIDENYLQVKLHIWFWSACFMPFIHYSLISNGLRSNGEIISMTFYWISTVVYLGLMLIPIVQKLRSRIPDGRY